MSQTPPERAHILFLFSDTGGGHRSATEAIIEALNLEYDGHFTTEMVDIFKEYAPQPLNRAPEFYARLSRVPQAWGVGYRLSDGSRRARLLAATSWPYLRRQMRKLVERHPSDLIVSLHPLANAPALRALGKKHPPFITVVTDLVTVHAFWYHPHVDLCVVPTSAAYRRAIKFGMKAEQMRVIGLPVADRFCRPAGDRSTIRARLEWDTDRPMILLVGGGEGMGPLEKTARAIAKAGLPAGLAVITGRNKDLKARLESYSWPEHTYIYGFVRQMPDFMQAADILVTKAGPGTISEAFNAGLPLILYSRLPGQEEGNVSYVTSQGAGVWAPRTDEIVAALADWLSHPGKHRQAAAAARRLARPQAAREIAHLLAAQVGIETR